MKDYYKLLGVSNFADEVAIKRAYRRLAKYYHPDINKSPNAALKFIEIKVAYDTLLILVKEQPMTTSCNNPGLLQYSNKHQ